jgi:multiple sugar transport system substrate-binding protein
MNERGSRRTFHARLEEMVDQLRNDIIGGKYVPGEYLPSETALVEQFQLSNKSVRRGLDTLVQEGLIVKIHRLGSMVTEAATRAKITITMAYQPSIERDMVLSNLLAEFKVLHPSIRVKLVTVHSIDMIAEYLSSGSVDVCTMNHQHFQGLKEKGLLHILEQVEPKSETYRFLNDAFTLSGNLYVQPLIFSPVVLCYNKAHFMEAGLLEPDSNWTWQDAIDTAMKLTRTGKRHGLYFHILSVNRWPIFLLQSGTRFNRDNNGKLIIRGSRLLDGIRFSAKLIHNRTIFPQYYSENSDDVTRLFLEGKVSMIMINYMSLNELKHSSIEFDISPLPYMQLPSTLTVAIGAAVSKYSGEKEAAKQLVDFLASDSCQKRIRERSLSLPAWKPAAEYSPEGDELKRPSRFPLFREILPTMHFHEELNLSRDEFFALLNELKLYWSNMIDEDELCERIEQIGTLATNV